MVIDLAFQRESDPSRETGRGEISVRRRDGGFLVVEAIASSTRGRPSGELTGYIAVHRDLGDG